MLYKSKINLSLILLIIGLGLIPTGFFIKEYLRDDVPSQIPSFLIDLEDEVNTEIEANYLGLGIYSIIPAVYDQHIQEIQNNFALVFGIPSTLLYLKNATLELLPMYINTSRAVSAIIDTLTALVSLNSTSNFVANQLLFNNYTLQDDYDTAIEGISEYMTGGIESLNYSDNARGYLSFGREYDGISYPGLREDDIYGTGLLDWLDFYYNAEADIGTNRSLIQTVYNCTWASGQLQNLSTYITSYLWEVVVKSDYAPMEIETYAERVFYDQWANASWVLTGFDLTYFSEYFNTSITGLEVGRDNPTYINYTTAINLWDPLNTSSFVNDEGILKWFHAYKGNTSVEDELKSDFELNDALMSRLYTWLFTTVKNNLVRYIYPLPEPIGIGMSISEYADILYAGQWANGTYIEDGFDLGVVVEPFELGIPTKSNISLVSTVSLLDPSNSSSFIDRDGILRWIDAYEGDTTAQNELINIFNLDLVQLNLINDWLFNRLRYTILPLISSDYTGLSISGHAQYEFYRQWANGTTYIGGIDIGPFKGLDSISGWELGIPTAANIDKYTVYALWGQNLPYSLVNWKDVSYWFKAMNNEYEYNFLQEYFNTTRIRVGVEYYYLSLSFEQLDAILEWLVDIRDNFVLINIQNQGNLPTDNYTLSNNIFFMFTIAGGVISAIGVLGVVVSLITKRK
ncbi:MAG: hypothetical protein ACFFCY_05345 [Promethearchaeota archaeon]